MKVIVFGGTGWLGHSIVLNLTRRGYDVTIGCRGRKKLFCQELSGIKTVTVDKRDEESMRNVLAESYDAIIDTVPTLESIALIHAYGRGLRHYLHCSSTGGYAPLPFIPCNETAPYGGFDTTSGWAEKAQVDRKVLQLFLEDGFPATVIRPCYITGPGMLPLDNLGGRRDDYIHDILTEKVLDVPDNGLALLQPIHVKDLANAFRLALEHPRSISQIYNICLSHAVTLNQYHQITANALGKTLHLNHMPQDDILLKYQGRIHELGLRFLATHMCFSIEKAMKDLEYRPHCTPEEAIAETALWAAERL